MHRKHKALLSVLVIGLLVAASAFASGSSEKHSTATSGHQIVIRFAFGGPETLPLYIAAKEYFQPQVESQSHGKIKVELFANSVLGDDVNLIQQVRAGNLAATGPVTSPLVGVDPEFEIFDIPFLFSTEKVADYVLDGPVGKEMSASLAKKGILNLGWSEMGYRYLTNSRRVVKTPADVKGLKIRVMQDPIQIAMWRDLGANPTPMAVSEVFTALKQDAVDGQENPWSAIVGWKFYEVNKYITLTGHIYSPMMFLFSKKVFDSYPKADQQLIRKLAEETALKGRQIARQQDAKYMKQVEESGNNVITTLTPAQKKLWQKATMPVWNLVEQKVGATLISQLKAQLAKAPQ